MNIMYKLNILRCKMRHYCEHVRVCPCARVLACSRWMINVYHFFVFCFLFCKFPTLVLFSVDLVACLFMIILINVLYN